MATFVIGRLGDVVLSFSRSISYRWHCLRQTGTGLTVYGYRRAGPTHLDEFESRGDQRRAALVVDVAVEEDGLAGRVARLRQPAARRDRTRLAAPAAHRLRVGPLQRLLCGQRVVVNIFFLRQHIQLHHPPRRARRRRRRRIRRRRRRGSGEVPNNAIY